MSFSSFTKTLDYPIFGLSFISNDEFVVCGGGGEGRHGIPNGIDVFKIMIKKEDDKKAEENKQQKLPKVFKQHDLQLVSLFRFDKNTTDAPMSVASTVEGSKAVIYVGCSDGKEKIKKSGTNNELKTFNFDVSNPGDEEIEFIGPNHVFDSEHLQTYIKKIKICSSSKGSVVAMLNSDAKSIFAVSSISKSSSYDFMTLDSEEFKDFDIRFTKEEELYSVLISKTKARLVDYCSEKPETTLINLEENTMSIFKKDYQFSKLLFLTDDLVLILGSLSQTKQIFYAVYSIETKKITQAKVLASKIKSITSVDYKPLISHENQGLLALGTSNLSIMAYHVNISSLRDVAIHKLYEFKQVHTFALTNMEISRDISYIVSVSAANTINTIVLPANESDLVNLLHYKSNMVAIIQILVMVLVVLIALYLSKYNH